MRVNEARARLLEEARGLLAGIDSPLLGRFLAHWPAAVDPAVRVEAAGRRPAQPLPVLAWLPRMAAAGADFAAGFVAALCRASDSLDWRQTYTVEEVGAAFLASYGWSEILPAGAAGSGARLSCGILVLGPHTVYPPHRHEAEEIYLPLRGAAEWRQGDALWRRRRPGELIHHSSEEPHAMRTGDEPLLAMYLWRGADLGGHARLDGRSGA